MPAAFARWTVLAHGPLEPLSDNLWRVEGALPDMALRRVMTLARRSDGGLLVHNAIALGEEAMSALEALGPPSVLLVPNGWHRLDAPAYQQRYPGLRVYCPAGARKRVERVVAIDGSYDDVPPDAAVCARHVEGIGQREGVLEVRSAGGVTLVFNDLIFNQPHLPGLFGLVYRALGSSGPPRVTRIARLLMVKDRRALRADLERLAATPDLRRIVVSHIDVIDDRPAEVLRSIAAAL